MENLEKLMYNAYEGVSPMIFPTAPKPVRSFFRMNRGTCKEWLGRIRGYLVTIGNHAGMPAIAVRNGFEALNDLKTRTKVVVCLLFILGMLLYTCLLLTFLPLFSRLNSGLYW